MAKIVVALGGNALGDTPEEQLELIKSTASSIVDLVEIGNDVIVSHGNGPQVGMMKTGLSSAYEQGVIKADMPMPECVAMSQGYIGYHLQSSIAYELRRRGLHKNVVTIVTQVVVDPADPAFNDPSKPIGMFYSKEAAEKLSRTKGYKMIEDAGRGYRQVVPSPKPVDIVEKDIIKGLVDRGTIVIVAGGGGIPVKVEDDKLIGIPAVIDKDFASEKIAELVGANMFIILTAVDMVSINFKKENEAKLHRLTVAEAEKYSAEGQFAKGSMGPKVQAAISFAKAGGTAIITSLENARKAVSTGEGCTIIA